MPENVDDRDTIPAPPPPSSDWPGLDDDTAQESPRALTPVPGSVKKTRSGEWELADPKRETAAQLCRRLGFEEPTAETREQNLEYNLRGYFRQPLPKDAGRY